MSSECPSMPAKPSNSRNIKLHWFLLRSGTQISSSAICHDQSDHGIHIFLSHCFRNSFCVAKVKAYCCNTWPPSSICSQLFVSSCTKTDTTCAPRSVGEMCQAVLFLFSSWRWDLQVNWFGPYPSGSRLYRLKLVKPLHQRVIVCVVALCLAAVTGESCLYLGSNPPGTSTNTAVPPNTSWVFCFLRWFLSLDWTDSSS